jgi:hypothetical protein
MRQNDLIPRQPRRMRQPRKAVLRQRIRNLEATVYRLEAELVRRRVPWWRRLAVWVRGVVA